MKRCKVIHIITGLSVGGAEKMLLNLLENDKYRSQFDLQVISLTNVGIIGEKISQLGIDVTALDIRYNLFSLMKGLFRLFKTIKKLRPDLIQTWLYHADLLGGIVGRIYNKCPIVWGIHNAFLDEGAKKSTRYIVKICSCLSPIIPNIIVSCSNAAITVHKKVGYKNIFKYIPNGFDTEKFKYNDMIREHVRNKLGLAKTTKVFGIIARYDPIKDHKNFLLACKLLKEKAPDVKFVLCGSDIDWDNEELVNIINESQLKSNIILIGYQDNVYEVILALDVLVVSSKSEAFPLVIGEAMSCGIPCISTDVGDASLIIGDTGIIVEPRNFEAMGKAMAEIYSVLDYEKEDLRHTTRKQILDNFSIDKTIKEYINLYNSLIFKGTEGRLFK